MFICTNNAASKSIILSSTIFSYEKSKNYSIQSFKECLFFISSLFNFCYYLITPSMYCSILVFYCSMLYSVLFYIVLYYVLFLLKYIEEKRSRSNTGEQLPLMLVFFASVYCLNLRNSHFIFIGADGIFQMVFFKTVFGFCFCQGASKEIIPYLSGNHLQNI